MKVNIINESSIEPSAYEWLLEHIDSVEFDWELQVAFTDTGVEIRYIDSKKLGSFKVDFETGRLGYRWQKGSPKSEPIFKAIGSSVKKVLDCTGGFGRDGFLLANNGYQVVTMERNPIIFCLLEDGIRRMSPELSKKIKPHWEVRYGCWTEANQKDFDCFYFDPMFPDTDKKSALNKKENQYLQLICAEDFETSEIINLGKKVVIKRPVEAFPLIEKPKNQIISGSIRFDIY